MRDRSTRYFSKNKNNFDWESPIKAIVGFAHYEEVDLIVVGTRGRSGIKKMLLGSIASGIVSYANCPVFMAK